MGRKQNPMIAAHYIRGAKHGPKTNRYAQTCRHCGLEFPTGRPESLLAHLANCPALSQEQQADVRNQIFDRTLISNIATGVMDYDQSQDPVAMADHANDFDFTGLNVLAGAAENAEDMVIDPRIAGHDDIVAATTAAETQPQPFYDNGFGHDYHHASSSHVWQFPFTTMQSPPSSFQDFPGMTTTTSALSAIASPSVPQFLFAPIETTPVSYVTHPSNNAPIAFVGQDEDDFDTAQGGPRTSGWGAPSNTKVRKNREPYNEPKRARVAEMRQIGACIRCSRLRKTCDPTRPCKACTQTASKTWIGGCVSLSKGQEFVVWYSNSLHQEVEDRIATIVGDQVIWYDNGTYLEIAYPVGNRSHVVFSLLDGESEAPYPGGNGPAMPGSHILVIQQHEDVGQKLLNYAIDNQEFLIEAIDTPALYATVRAAQGLSLQHDEAQNLVLGSSKQLDAQLGRLFDLWLLVFLITSETFHPTISIFNQDGRQINDNILTQQVDAIISQINASIETAIHKTKDEFRKLDANILIQTYKHLFNLVVAMFLMLDVIERYCCFMKKSGLLSPTAEATMLEQAQTLAYKYAYCAQNIQMIPKPTFNVHTKMLEGDTTEGRVNHEMQRVWMVDLCLSKDDLEACMADDANDDWVHPIGRLWAQLFEPLRARE